MLYHLSLQSLAQKFMVQLRLGSLCRHNVSHELAESCKNNHEAKNVV